MLFSRMKFTERDFRFIQELLLDQAGISLGHDKSELVYSRLARRLRQLGLSDFSKYCELLKEKDSKEIQHCLNAITTNHTSFFREEHHFQFLSNSILPELIEKSSKSGKGKLRIWSAGCSSGEEPYSIAMTLKEYGKEIHDWDISILATDIDSNILEHAESAVYRKFDEKDPVFKMRKKWFQKGSGSNDGLVKIVPEVKKLVKFRKMNLKGSWSHEEKFDVVFCRNVMIYFDTEIKRQIFTNFASSLSPGGYLIVGHSESLNNLSTEFEALGGTVHRKKKT